MNLNLPIANHNLAITRFFFVIAIVISFFCQIYIDSSNLNIIYNVTALVISIISITYLFQKNIILKHPISSLSILGYVLYYFILPPLATNSEGKSIINNLILPLQTLIHTSLLLCFLITSHIIYIETNQYFKLSNIWKRYFIFCNIFSNISGLKLTFFVFLVLLSQLSTIFFKTGNEDNEFLKLLQGINYFIFLPFILLNPGLFNLKENKNHYLLLFYYFITILLVGVLLNGRSFVFLGIASIFISYLFNFGYGFVKLSLSKTFFLRFFVCVLCVFFLINPITKLSIAFVMARNVRNDISPIELINETVFQYRAIENPKEILETLKELQESSLSLWDEHYVDNPFLARLCNLKFADNSLVIINELSIDEKAKFRQIELHKIISLLPYPIIKVLNISVDKNEVTSGSSGDFLFYIQTGDINSIGTFRTGSLIGSSFAIFGWYYLIILSFVFFLIFPAIDSLAITNIHQNGTIHFSPIAFVSFFPLLFCFTSAATGSESISSLLGIFRMLIEKPILFYIILKLISLAKK